MNPNEVPENIDLTDISESFVPHPEGEKKQGGSGHKKEYFVEEYINWIRSEIEKKPDGELGEGFWQLYKSQCYAIYEKYKPTTFDYFAELTFGLLTALLIAKLVDFEAIREMITGRKKEISENADNNTDIGKNRDSRQSKDGENCTS